MTQRLDKINKHINGKGSGPKLEPCHQWARGPIKNENKHRNPNKMERLHWLWSLIKHAQSFEYLQPFK